MTILHLRSLLPYLLSTLLLLGVGTSGCEEASGSGPDPVDTVDTTDTVSTIDSVSADTLRTGTFDGELGSGGRCVWVAPYRRSDGTCVRGHWRSTPDSSCPWVGTVYKECD